MPTTIARIKQAGKHFEIIVDLDEALNFKKGKSEFISAEGDKIFTDSKKGNIASNSDLQDSFKTTDLQEIVFKIIKNGEILLTQEYRSAEQEKKFKQVIDFLVTNAIDPQSGNPHTAERIKSAIDQSSINIKNVPLENQISDIISELSKIIPIKLQTKKVKITIPAMHTGKAYGVVTQYKTQETWLGNGDLEVLVEIPAGIIMDFYDKLNSTTHGSALTEELKEE